MNKPSDSHQILKGLRASNSRVDQVHAILRDAIISWRFKPGERLYQAGLARQFGVSQMVIREAIDHLDGEGLVTKETYRGVRARPHTIQDLEDLYRLRLLLEGDAVELAAERMNAGELAQMRALLPQTAFNYDDFDSLPAAIASHREFHWIAIRASQHRYLIHFLDHIWNLTNPYLLYSPELRRSLTADALQRSVDTDLIYHRALLEALEARDGVKARATNQEHLLDGLETLEEHMRLFVQPD